MGRKRSPGSIFTALSFNSDQFFASRLKEKMSNQNSTMSSSGNYDEFMQRAKQFANDGFLHRALTELMKAKVLDDNEKVRRRISEIREVLDEESDNTDSDETDSEEEQDVKRSNNLRELKNGLKIDANICSQLFPHQLEGVEFLWSNIHLNKLVRGGLLSDEMGLGKTIQVAAFMSALIDMGEAKHFLLVLPTSLIRSWEKEIKKWCPSINIFKFISDYSQPKRKAQLKLAQRSTSVLITTYGLVSNEQKQLCLDHRGYPFKWDYVILDEGHYIKNLSNNRTKEANKLLSKYRLVLTGTPIMNNLDDLFALVHFFTHGNSFLGDNRNQFRLDYKIPIEKARVKGSSARDIIAGNQASANLRRLTEPYILHRTKDSVNKAHQDNEEQPVFPELGMKHDFVLWCCMTPRQQKIYSDFLATDEVRHALMSNASPLVQCTVLNKICSHPRRLSNLQCAHLGLAQSTHTSVLANAGDDCAVNYLDGIDMETLLSESGKLTVLDKLVDQLEEKFLIFSRSLKVLDIIQRLLLAKNFKLLRMDGNVKPDERHNIVNIFQNDSSVRCLLLTTGVGSVGLTLTAATRVIIFDPSWNPSLDDQAVDRVHRIGQTKPVVVFRLITCDTIEERIYRRQIFKKSIISQNNGENDDPFRHFKKEDIWELFNPPVNPQVSDTQQKFISVFEKKRESYDKLDTLLKKLDTFNGADNETLIHAGVHDHNMVFDPKNQKLVDEALNDHPVSTKPKTPNWLGDYYPIHLCRKCGSKYCAESFNYESPDSSEERFDDSPGPSTSAFIHSRLVGSKDKIDQSKDDTVPTTSAVTSETELDESTINRQNESTESAVLIPDNDNRPFGNVLAERSLNLTNQSSPINPVKRRRTD